MEEKTFRLCESLLSPSLSSPLTLKPYIFSTRSSSVWLTYTTVHTVIAELLWQSFSYLRMFMHQSVFVCLYLYLWHMHAAQLLRPMHVIMCKGVLCFSIVMLADITPQHFFFNPTPYLRLLCKQAGIFTKGVYKVNLFFRSDCPFPLWKALHAQCLLIAKASLTKMLRGPLVTFNILTFSCAAHHSHPKKRISKANCITTVLHWKADIS